MMKPMLRALLCVVAMLPAVAQPAPAHGLGRYRVEFAGTEDADAVADQLLAICRCALEPYSEVVFTGMVIRATPATARLVSSDPRVARVEEMQSETETPAQEVPHPAPAAAVHRVGTEADTSWTTGPYQYDGSGNIKSINARHYAYDSLGRLTFGGEVNGHNQKYAYDAAGNLLKIETYTGSATPARVNEMSVNPATNRVQTFTGAHGTTAAQYDSAGRLLQMPGATFAYDAGDMMTESRIVTGGATPKVTRSVYLYSAGDERIATIMVSDANVELGSNWTIRDLSGKVLRHFKATASPEQWVWDEDYIYRDGQLLAAEVAAAERTRHFHSDHLGTPRLITGAGGAELSSRDLHPFGDEILPPDNEPMKFTGHERENDALDYMHARYYTFGWGRFLSVDPAMDVAKNMAEPQRWNRYSYVTNNPMKFTDPDGREKTIYFLGGLNHRITAYEEIDTIRGFVESQSGYSLNLRSQMSRSQVLGSLGNLDSTDIAVVNAHSWDLNLQTERGATGRETFTASSIVSAFSRGGNPQALVLAGCRSQDVARAVANQTGVVTFGTTARATSREVGFAATVLATIYARTGNAAQAVKVANSILQKGACPKSDPGCTAPRPEFVYFEPEKKK